MSVLSSAVQDTLPEASSGGLTAFTPLTMLDIGLSLVILAACIAASRLILALTQSFISWLDRKNEDAIWWHQEDAHRRRMEKGMAKDGYLRPDDLKDEITFTPREDDETNISQEAATVPSATEDPDINELLEKAKSFKSPSKPELKPYHENLEEKVKKHAQQQQQQQQRSKIAYPIKKRAAGQTGGS